MLQTTVAKLSEMNGTNLIAAIQTSQAWVVNGTYLFSFLNINPPTGKVISEIASNLLLLMTGSSWGFNL